ncbi:tetratricopeptide repeat protein [Hymenobacter roseosalivarius]|uniref:tetratricopeptide repeat protein n=1 Tax=Hymenobacter roseosalivarius TaxID=89967 RepID=UPI000A0564D2|nr:SEL1-like repeat protein [Hymenobacter roseosalivarius]
MKRLIQIINRANFGRYASNRFIAQTALLLVVRVEKKDATAAYWLATLYWDGWEVPQNHQRALKLFHLAAGGNRKANCNLAVAYDNGLSVKINRAKAFTFFATAARLSAKEAMHAVGDMFQKGKALFRT